MEPLPIEPQPLHPVPVPLMIRDESGRRGYKQGYYAGYRDALRRLDRTLDELRWQAPAYEG